MNGSCRLILLVLEVADLERSAALYRDGFGLDLHIDDHGGGDRWVSGAHAATSWSGGAFLHFALYQAKGSVRTTGTQAGFVVDNVTTAHAMALAAGAILIHEPRAEPWGSTSRYYDFDGNVVSLTQQPGAV
jgi:catechol 2,3-dioxygenase-like lactoylglutathione lyase family enzyme